MVAAAAASMPPLSRRRRLESCECSILFFLFRLLCGLKRFLRSLCGSAVTLGWQWDDAGRTVSALHVLKLSCGLCHCSGVISLSRNTAKPGLFYAPLPSPFPASPLGPGKIRLQPAGVHRPRRRHGPVLVFRPADDGDPAVSRCHRQRPGRDRRQLAWPPRRAGGHPGVLRGGCRRGAGAVPLPLAVRHRPCAVHLRPGDARRAGRALRHHRLGHGDPVDLRDDRRRPARHRQPDLARYPAAARRRRLVRPALGAVERVVQPSAGATEPDPGVPRARPVLPPQVGAARTGSGSSTWRPAGSSWPGRTAAWSVR